MEVPPVQHQPNPPAQKSNANVVVLIIIGSVGCLCVVLAILAAILFPVFSQAKMSAKKSACLSNIKMQSTGMLMYSVDWDDRVAQHR